MDNSGISKMLHLIGALPGTVWIGKEAAEQMGLVFLPNIPGGDWMCVAAKDAIVDKDNRTIGFRDNHR